MVFFKEKIESHYPYIHYVYFQTVINHNPLIFNMTSSCNLIESVDATTSLVNRIPLDVLNSATALNKQRASLNEEMLSILCGNDERRRSMVEKAGCWTRYLENAVLTVGQCKAMEERSPLLLTRSQMIMSGYEDVLRVAMASNRDVAETPDGTGSMDIMEKIVHNGYELLQGLV